MRFRSILKLMATVSVAALCAATEPATTLHNPAAKNALDRRDSQAKKAEADLNAKILAADKSLAEDLQRAAGQAMKDENLKAANELTAYKNQIDERIADAKSAEKGALDGKWLIRLRDDHGLWIVSEQSVTHVTPGGEKDTATVTRQGASLVARYRNGWLERFTPAGPRICFENWEPKMSSKFPNAVPTDFGCGERVAK